MICSTCKLDISTVGEVRGCSLCQRNGTSGAVHAKFANTDPIEKMVAEANPGAFPFEPVVTDQGDTAASKIEDPQPASTDAGAGSADAPDSDTAAA